MTPTRTTSPIRLRRRSLRGLLDTNLAAVVVATIVAYLIGPLLPGGPDLVGSVAVVNASEYDIQVQVSDDDRGGWMSLTTAESESTSVTSHVIDQGDAWVFRFSAQGRDGGELRMTRADLDQADWSVEIPDAVVDHLRQQGAPPTP
ncbi:hypothetical protein BH18ACT4_BH18ACT4_16110 [soil metagenome]